MKLLTGGHAMVRASGLLLTALLAAVAPGSLSRASDPQPAAPAAAKELQVTYYFLPG
jgi:hypothetical protein